MSDSISETKLANHKQFLIDSKIEHAENYDMSNYSSWKVGPITRIISYPKNLNNVHILKNDRNRGKGYSIMKGLKYSSKLGCTHSVTLDADNQHNPESIEDFIEKAEGCELVLGYRGFEKPMPLHRVLSNKITTYIISKMYFQRKLPNNIKQVNYLLTHMTHLNLDF